jgi:hypothetical protein
MSTMERLFSPCTRYRDLFGDYNTELLQELNLDVSTEEVLSAERAFTYGDLYAMVENEDKDTVVWLTPHAAVVRGSGDMSDSYFNLDGWCSFRFSADGKDIDAWGGSPEHVLEICDAVLRLMAVSVIDSVLINERYYPDDVLINAPSLAYLMEQCQSLKVLTLKELRMDENHCRVLGAYSRPGIEIVLFGCKLTSNGASALAEVLGRNQGPTKLDYCKLDNLVLANGLRGNSRLKSLNLIFSYGIDADEGNRQIHAIASALRENKGLVEWDFRINFLFSDETWNAVCDALKAHPTLEVLGVRASFAAPAGLESRIQTLVDMLKVNMSIHTIQLNDLYCEHKLFRESVIPYLETNRLRPRLLAIQKTLPHAYRAKVLGRALLSARTDANSFWMLLSGNAEVAFPSTTTTIAAAANLPTTTTAAATYTANAGPVAVSLMSTLTTTATGSLPTNAAAAAASAATSSASNACTPSVAAAAAANAGIPSGGQKRKARP